MTHSHSNITPSATATDCPIPDEKTAETVDGVVVAPPKESEMGRAEGVVGSSSSRISGVDKNTTPTNPHEGTKPMRFVLTSLIRLASPIVVGSVLSFSAQAITNGFVGRRLGPERFAHFSVGVSVSNLFAFSISSGLNGALDTFVSQAFGREGQNTRDIGISVQRGMLLSCLCLIPVSIVFVFGGPLFRLLFGDAIGDGALEFTRHAIPYAFAGFMKEIFTKTLQAINMPSLVLLSTIISAAACFVFNDLFTASVVSAVYALTATQALQLLVLVLCVRFHPRVTFWRQCDWLRPSADVYSKEGLREFLRIGVPSLVSLMSTWWAFEVLNVVAARISVLAVAALNLVLTIALLYFAIAAGISVATCVLIGNALGDNNPALARQFTFVGFALDQLLNLIDVSSLIFFRREIASLFTADEGLVDTFSNMVLVVGAYVAGDSSQFCLQSVFRGTGQQRAAVKVVLPSLWIVGVPMSFVCGELLGWGAMGVVLGMATGFLTEAPLLGIQMLRWDWPRMAREASRRLGGVGVGVGVGGEGRSDSCGATTTPATEAAILIVSDELKATASASDVTATAECLVGPYGVEDVRVAFVDEPILLT